MRPSGLAHPLSSDARRLHVHRCLGPWFRSASHSETQMLRCLFLRHKLRAATNQNFLADSLSSWYVTLRAAGTKHRRRWHC